MYFCTTGVFCKTRGIFDEFNTNLIRFNQQRGKITLQISSLQAKILKELLADGRKSEEEIAKTIGTTKLAVKSNYTKLVKLGIIKGATTHINYRLFGFKAVAYLIITINPKQTYQLSAYLQKMPEVYAFFNKGIPGIVDVITILKTVEHLNEVKDQFKNNFEISEMKTAIWTDVKEMNYNLAIIAENRRNITAPSNNAKKPVQPKNGNTLDELDQKIADALSINGRISIVELAKATNVSSSIAKRRYDRLKERGALKVTIQVDPHKIGYQALCIFFTTISFEKLQSIIQEISKIPDIISIMKTTGNFDLQIYAMIADLDQMLFIKEELSKIDGIISMDFEVNRISEKMDKWPSPRQYSSTF